MRSRWPRYIAFVFLCLPLLQAPAFAGEIHEAVAAGDSGRVAELLAGDGSLVGERDANATADFPLHTAAIVGNLEIANLLLDSGADIDCGDSDQSTPLDVAALRRQAAMVDLLIERGADVNRRDRNSSYPLSFAAAGGDSAIVERLIAAGSDLNFRSTGNVTLMHYAAFRALESLAGRLIAEGYDIDPVDINGGTPLAWAARTNQVGMMELLVAHGADPAHADSNGSVLQAAAERGSLEAIDFLVERGVDIDHANRWGITPLMMALMRDQTEAALALIGHGANPDAVTNQGSTTLIRAVESGSPAVVERLVAAGATVDAAVPSDGRTALLTAVTLGYRDIVSALLAAGADPNLAGSSGLAPLAAASVHGHAAIADDLVANGASGSRGEAPVAVADAPGNGEARIWYLNHSGWAVRTSDNLLIFDYYEDGRAPDEPCLANGAVDPGEIAGLPVTVFASHVHADHFDPVIFEWREDLPDVTYVMGFQPEGATGYEYVPPRETRVFDDVKVTAIPSNDSGEGFVVEVDGLVIFHPGDHANRLRDLSGTYKPEIDWLIGEGVRPDIVFMPISGCNFGDQVAVKIGVEYTLDEMKPQVFLPMHSGGNPARYAEFVGECCGRHPGVVMGAPSCKGECFRYADGRLASLIR